MTDDGTHLVLGSVRLLAPIALRQQLSTELGQLKRRSQARAGHKIIVRWTNAADGEMVAR